MTSLVAAAKGGDIASLELLLLRHYNQLLGHVRSKLSDDDRRRRDAEDIVQQTHQRVFESMDTFRGTTPKEFCNWLYRICDNTLADSRRRQNSGKRSGYRRRVSFESNETIALWSDICDAPSPSRVAIEREERAQLEAALSKLTQEEFELIQMRYIDQKSSTEIAETTGMSRSSVTRKCMNTLHRIRNLIAEDPV